MLQAWDKRKLILPVLHELGPLQGVLENPGEFTDRRSDIEEFVPKFESMFNQRNRIPATGRFDDDFAQNMKSLVEAIMHSIGEVEDQVCVTDESALLQLRRSDSRPAAVDIGIGEVTRAAREQVQLISQAGGREKAALLGNMVTILRDPPPKRTIMVGSGAAAEVVLALQETLPELQPVLQAEFAAACIRNMASRPEHAPLRGYAKFEADWCGPMVV